MHKPCCADTCTEARAEWFASRLSDSCATFVTAPTGIRIHVAAKQRDTFARCTERINISRASRTESVSGTIQRSGTGVTLDTG